MKSSIPCNFYHPDAALNPEMQKTANIHKRFKWCLFSKVVEMPTWSQTILGKTS